MKGEQEGGIKARQKRKRQKMIEGGTKGVKAAMNQMRSEESNEGVKEAIEKQKQRGDKITVALFISLTSQQEY